ncbi:unnamed protein product, partial [Rotaria sp. Silwood2]
MRSLTAVFLMALVAAVISVPVNKGLPPPPPPPPSP